MSGRWCLAKLLQSDYLNLFYAFIHFLALIYATTHKLCLFAASQEFKVPSLTFKKLPFLVECVRRRVRFFFSC